MLAGLLVRALDPDPLVTHPLYPVKLEAVGYGLLMPVYFVNSGLTLDFSGFVEHPAALVTVLAFLLAFLLERGAPALAFRRDLGRAEVLAVGLLQATSLTFLLAAVAIGHEMGLLDRGTPRGVPALPDLPRPDAGDDRRVGLGAGRDPVRRGPGHPARCLPGSAGLTALTFCADVLR